MAKSLVIVESPAKAKTINKYLGSQFIVRSSVGHVRDLPVSGQGEKSPARKAATPGLSPELKAWRALVARMGVDPEDHWKANYQVLPGKEKVVDELRRLAQEADTIYLATDLDREGEAIAWHLREVIGGDAARYQRVVFNEITKNAISEAFNHPGRLNQDRVDAQQARRFLDRVVGYMVSPLLWERLARGLSAGRVQSVAVRLIVEREREIGAFVPEEYWELHADTQGNRGEDLRLQVVRDGKQAFRPTDRGQIDLALEQLRTAAYQVVQREDKPTRTRPAAPFITSTLQQAASTRLGFSVKKTMTLAQRLYEAGHITYMRTDSTNLSAEAVDACRQYILEHMGAAYLPEKALSYAAGDNAQEAHEAIRPSDVAAEPGQVAGLERDAERLYELIWRQFVACQMPDAQYLTSTLTVQADRFELKARGRILKFDGYTRILPPAQRDKEEVILPDIAAGESLRLVKLLPSQHFTKPTPRYTEATLVRELEKRGIGRPSTYAAIISTIQERSDVKVEQKRFYAEKMGEIVTERLVESFTNLLDYDFTAHLEGDLDKIAKGQLHWEQVLDAFYVDFHQRLKRAADDEGMRRNQPTATDIPCPLCARPMMIRTAATGVFLGCSGYALPVKERCKGTINLVPGDEVLAIDDSDEEGETRELRAKRRCPICQSAMNAYLIDEQRKLHVCGHNPDCNGYIVESGHFRLKGYEGPVLTCDKCGQEMQLKTGRFGKYFACTSAACGNTRKLLRNGEAAPPKSAPIALPHLRCQRVDDYFLLRDGAAGLFLAASTFPKHRETRAPTIAELKSVADQIDPKYAYLLTAPEVDAEGRPAVLKFARKTREQYVASEEQGKATGWQAHYREGHWQVSRGGKSA